MAHEPGKFWIPLDNAAKIFPAITGKEVTSVFRLTAVLKHSVKLRPLQIAVLLAEKRFPYYMVRICKGFFWYYLEDAGQNIPIEVDNNVLCREFSKNGLLIRILVRDNRLSAEFSHILADGSAAFEFFREVIKNYSLACTGGLNEVDNQNSFLGDISEEEYEDAYKRYFKAEIPPMLKRSKAFHIPFTLKTTPCYSRSTAIIDLQQLKEIAGQKGVTITVYLVGVYFFILQAIAEKTIGRGFRKKNGIIRVQLPINLRNIFSTKTMRNFSLFVMPEIDLRLGRYSFDEILKTVYYQIKLESDIKLINKNISRNVSGEKKIYVRGIPLVLKSFLLRMKYYSLGARQFSGVLTNLGKIELPGEAGELVDYFIVTPPPPNKLLKINCSVVGYGNKLALSFGNITQSEEFEERFFKFLRSENIEVEIDN